VSFETPVGSSPPSDRANMLLGRQAITENHDLDMIAAALRADASDLSMFLDVTATKLEDALPDHTVVKRASKLLRKRHRVAEIRVTLGTSVYALRRHHSGIQSSVTHVVHGINLSTDDVNLEEWLTRLSRELAKYAAEQARGREALDRLLR